MAGFLLSARRSCGRRYMRKKKKKKKEEKTRNEKRVRHREACWRWGRINSKFLQ